MNQRSICQVTFGFNFELASDVFADEDDDVEPSDFVVVCTALDILQAYGIKLMEKTE